MNGPHTLGTPETSTAARLTVRLHRNARACPTGCVSDVA
jgi:hypothetical protein